LNAEEIFVTCAKILIKSEMNKSIVIVFLTALTFAACTLVSKQYVIEGVVPDDSYNNFMVYMYDTGAQKAIDSALVVNGKFKFKGSVDNAVICQLVLNRRLYADFILEKGKISVDMADPESAKGTSMNNKLSKYYSEMAVIEKEAMDKFEEIQQNQDIDEEIINEIIEQYMPKIEQLGAKYLDANKNNVLGAFILWRLSDYLSQNPDKFDLLYAQAGDVVRNFKPLQDISETNAIKRQTADGMPFIDFTIENGNRDGSKASFSDYVGKGKYVLVDFWASWCGPCIAEIPVLVEVYNKYKGDKFEILGVAVWDRLAETLRAIETHKTPWPQILDAGDIPTNLYGIRGIPHIILFDPDGKIIARDLRGANLKAKVAEVMQ
jgi:thiol-disulfide isomerase/thioredoxin